MQDEIETALRLWALIRPDLGQSPRPFEAERISHWLSVDVSGVIRQLVQRADFRELACAPVTHLCRGPVTEEGRLIENIDQALITTAGNLLSFLQRPAICQILGLSPVVHPRPPVSQLIQSDDICIGDCSSLSRLQVSRHVESDTPHQRSLDDVSAYLVWIANHPWRCLTSASDYFGSNALLNLTPEAGGQLRQLYGGPIPSQAEFTPLCQPRLQLPDDFIFTCFELRVEHWLHHLNISYNQIARAVNANSSTSEADREALPAVWCPVQQQLRELRRLWHASPRAAERRTAIQLMQIYAAFHPESSFDWLGDEGIHVRSAHYFRDRVEERENRQIAEYIALALTTLRDLYRRMEDVDDQIQRNAQTHRLCIIEGRQRREVYWDGVLLGIDWGRHQRAWFFLSNLTEVAVTTRQGIDSTSVPSISLRDARRDLTRLLPGNLSELIIGTPSTAYRLDLSSSAVYHGFFNEYEVLESVANLSRRPCQSRR